MFSVQASTSLPNGYTFSFGNLAFFSKQQNTLTGSVGQQRLPQEYLFNCKIPLPPLAEQQRIAAILKKQMAAVEKATSGGGRKIGSY